MTFVSRIVRIMSRAVVGACLPGLEVTERIQFRYGRADEVARGARAERCGGSEGPAPSSPGALALAAE